MRQKNSSLPLKEKMVACKQGLSNQMLFQSVCKIGYTPKEEIFMQRFTTM